MHFQCCGQVSVKCSTRNLYNLAELVAIDMESEGGLGGTSENVFGPLAVALVGYHPEEFEMFRSFMIDMEADIVKVNSRLFARTIFQQ